MTGTTPPIFAGPFKAASRNSLPDGVVWPVQRATLAALIDIGLSNAEIAAYSLCCQTSFICLRIVMA